MTATADARPDLFLPEPEPREVHYTVISVDDHLVEPPDLFAGRLPAALADRARAVLGDQDGREVWEFEGARFTQVGMNAMAGRRPVTMRLEPSRFSEMRPGCYDIDARIHDMDINGVWASLNFPSSIRAAHQRAVALEHRCRMAWMVDAVGGGPGLPEPIVERFAQSDGNGFLGFWEAMARRVLRAEPELLDWQPGRTR